MTLWSIVEPVIIEARYDYPKILPHNSGAEKATNSIETIAQSALDQKSVESELRRLILDEGRCVNAASEILGIGEKTLRSICRTLRIGPYASLSVGQRRSRSSQIPYGWRLEGGILIEDPNEMKWVTRAQKMRQEGQSLHAIARYLNERAIPTKNGGKWHAKTISQILKFNSRK